MGSASDPDNPAPALHVRQAAHLRDASALRSALTDWAHARGLPAGLIGDIELVAYEALVNAAEHAYPDTTTGILDLQALDQRTVRVTVTDHGRWRPQPAPDPLRGRGLPLIHLLSDHAEVTPTDQGTVVR
ncbi:ATP-binding protein [Amycolatopsis sp. NPDC023774]|uniref:ATP-binding protein n=1 Tax=Amycolatopsis sp. NPDC023774 TaxID=3155015 RepID=UPI0033D3AF47